MLLSRDRPEILAPPPQPPACCTQQTITAGPQIAEKTRQKHDYPSAAWRTSYRRRTAAERLNATIKDTATTSIGRGWTRLTGLTPLMLSLACLTAVRNQRIRTAWDKRQQDDARPSPHRPSRPRQPRATAPANVTSTASRHSGASVTLQTAVGNIPAAQRNPGTAQRPRKRPRIASAGCASIL
jgi:hypothetical protein